MQGAPGHECEMFSGKLGGIGSFGSYVCAAYGEARQGRDAQIGEILARILDIQEN